MNLGWIFVSLGMIVIFTSVFGLYTLGIGVWGFVRKRPIIVPARQYMWVMLVAFIPSIIFSFVSLFPLETNDFLFPMPLISVVLLGVMIFIVWRQMKGYMIYGVSDQSFRDALIDVLEKSEFTYQETVSMIWIQELELDIQVMVTEWMGLAQIRTKDRKHNENLREIAAGLNEYFSTMPVKVNKTSFGLYSFLGLIMLVFALNVVWVVMR